MVFQKPPLKVELMQNLHADEHVTIWMDGKVVYNSMNPQAWKLMEMMHQDIF
jgi:hypothetical protein